MVNDDMGLGFAGFTGFTGFTGLGSGFRVLRFYGSKVLGSGSWFAVEIRGTMWVALRVDSIPAGACDDGEPRVLGVIRVRPRSIAQIEDRAAIAHNRRTM
jgi:hypothetical protein